MRSVAALMLAAATAIAGCIADPTIACNDQLCPATLVCTAGGCATPDERDACEDLLEGDACAPDRVCRGGACRAVICGDALVEGTEVCEPTLATCAEDCSSTLACGNATIDLAAAEQCDDGNSLSSDGCSSTCTLETATWREITPRSIAARYHAATAFDVARNAVVVFGGITHTTYLDDTWSYNGSQWARLSPIHRPPARGHAAMAWDPVSQRILLFGGASNLGQLGDTWAWDGIDWTELHPVHTPAAREGAAMVTVTDRNVITLVGGFFSQPGSVEYPRSAWEWDGADWTEHPTVGDPPGLVNHALGYDPVRRHVVAYGGDILRRKFVWTWNGVTWTSTLPDPAPTAVEGAAFLWDQVDARLHLVGGAGPFGGVTDEIWAWDTQWTARPKGPAPRRDHAIAVGAFGGTAARTIVVFGGRAAQNALLDDTWLRALGGWITLGKYTVAPSPRFASAMAYNGRGDLVLLGGFADTVTFGDTYRFDGENWIALDEQFTLAPRAFAALAYDRDRDRMVTFGGGAVVGFTTTFLATTHELTPSGWTSPQATGPSARWAASLAYDPRAKRTILFGGGTSDARFGDTWAWDGTTWTELHPATSPPPRDRAALAWDPLREHLVLFGGLDDTGPRQDTWTFDGVTWTELSPATSPPPRSIHGMAFDAQRGELLVYGGVGTNTRLEDTWAFSGTTWHPVDVLATAFVRAAPMAYDPIRRRAVLFGGNGLGAITNDTWALEWTSTEPVERCVLVDEDRDGDALAGCADPDCWGRCAPHCPPRASCPATAPRCGDATCSAVEDSYLCPDDC